MTPGFGTGLVIPDLWQQEAVRALQQGKDVVVQAPTGSGKTYIFELLAAKIMQVKLTPRIERRIDGLVHPVHQVLRVFGWEILRTNDPS